MSYIAHEQGAMNEYMGLVKGNQSSYMAGKKEDNYLDRLLLGEKSPLLYTPPNLRMQKNSLYSHD